MEYGDLNYTTAKINELLEKVSKPIFVLEQGAIDPNYNVYQDSLTRVRTNNYIPPGSRIVTSGDIVIWAVIYFEINGSYVDGINPKNQDFTTDTRYLSKVIFAKSNGTDTISVAEVYNSLNNPSIMSNLMDIVYDSINSKLCRDMMLLEQGMIDADTGVDGTNANRVRSRNYVDGGTRITASGDIVIWMVAYYNSSYQFVKAINPKNQSYITESGYKCRIVFAKTGGTSSVTPIEVYGRSYGYMLMNL